MTAKLNSQGMDLPMTLYAKRLNLTREQRHQIWQACYGRFRSGRAGLRISRSAE